MRLCPRTDPCHRCDTSTTSSSSGSDDRHSHKRENQKISADQEVWQGRLDSPGSKFRILLNSSSLSRGKPAKSRRRLNTNRELISVFWTPTPGDRSGFFVSKFGGTRHKPPNRTEIPNYLNHPHLKNLRVSRRELYSEACGRSPFVGRLSSVSSSLSASCVVFEATQAAFDFQPSTFFDRRPPRPRLIGHRIFG